jgi:hypothetical protein
MKRIILFSMAAALATAAAAQQYKWVDKDGRTQYGDFPPPGVKATPLRGPSAPASAPAAGAKGGAPLSPAEQEAAFRKRQQDGQKEAEKSALLEREAAAKKENCARAQAYLRSLESGGRISTTDSQGERVYLEDSQIASETAKARKALQENCSG